VDPVWEKITELSNELDLDIHLEDLSGKLGINWLRKEVLEDLGLLLVGGNPGEFQEFREDAGFLLDIQETYGDFFDEDTLASYFTPYSYWNVNIADEFTLEELFEIRTGDTRAAAEFRAKIQALRMEHTMILPGELVGFVGEQFDEMQPVLIAEAPLNIHYIDERLLDGLFRHFEAPQVVAERIKSGRETMELTDEWLTEAFEGAEFDEILLQYLGVKSWFWQIDIDNADMRLRWIVCRTPGRDEDTEGMQINLIQESVLEAGQP